MSDINIKNVFFAVFDYSGAKTYAEQLCRYFEQRDDIRLHIIYFSMTLYNRFSAKQEGKVISFYFPWYPKRNLEIYSRRITDVLSPWLDGKENMIIHLNHPNQNYLGQSFKKRYRAKVVYTMHYLMSYFTTCDEMHSYTDDTFQDGSGNAEMIAHVDKIICVTQFAAKIVEHYYKVSPDKFRVIYNGFGNKEKKGGLPVEQKIALRKKMGYNAEEVIVLYVGRIDKTKGCDKLVQAIGNLWPKHSNLRLILAGSGNYEHCLKLVGLNCARIMFAGHLAADDLSQLYQIADVGIIPSLWEQCSYVALEMMSYALPVIYTGVPGLRELFEDNISGKILRFYRIKAKHNLSIETADIEEAIMILSGNRKLMSRIGRSGQKVWEEKYTSETMGRQTIALYESLYP